MHEHRWLAETLADILAYALQNKLYFVCDHLAAASHAANQAFPKAPVNCIDIDFYRKR